jgi:UrcA family protein
MTISARRSISTYALLVGLTAAASFAVAGTHLRRSLEPVAVVQFSDLNTSTAEGSRILYGRISAAARAVCSRGGGWYPTQAWARQECYRSTVDRVVAELDLPMLTTLHLATTRRAQAQPDLQGAIARQ